MEGKGGQKTLHDPRPITKKTRTTSSSFYIKRIKLLQGSLKNGAAAHPLNCSFLNFEG
jgi:hypothetical protein